MATTLDERLEGTAEGWRPEPGDKVVGEIVDIDVTDGGFGVYPVLTIQQDDGSEIACHCFHTVVKNEIAKHQPQIGERVGIKYIGKREGKNGSSYESYRVAWERKAKPLPDWSALAADARAEGADDMQSAGGGQEDDIPFAPTGGAWGY